MTIITNQTEGNASNGGVASVSGGNNQSASGNGFNNAPNVRPYDGGSEGGSEGGYTGGGEGGTGEVAAPVQEQHHNVAPTSNPASSVSSATASSMSQEKDPVGLIDRQKEARRNAPAPSVSSNLAPNVSTESHATASTAGGGNQLAQEQSRQSANSLPQSAPRQSQAAPRRAASRPSVVDAEEVPDVIDNFPRVATKQVEQAQAQENARAEAVDERPRRLIPNVDVHNDRFARNNEDYMVNAGIRRHEGEDDQKLRQRLREASPYREFRDTSHPDYDHDTVSYSQYRNEFGKPARPKKLDTLEASTQTGGEEFANAEDAAPKEETRRDRKQQNFEEYRARNAYRRMRPLETLWVAGTRFVPMASNPEYEHMVFTDRVQNAINLIRDTYHCSTNAVFGLVLDATCLGIDNHGQVVKESPDTYEISEDQFVAACNQIYRSQKQYGHPMGVVGQHMKIGGTWCFPSGYVDESTLRDISQNEGSVLYGKSIKEIRNAIAKTWYEETQPDLLRNTQGKNRAQREAVYNYIRGNMSIDGVTGEAIGIPQAVNRTFFETLDENNRIAQARSSETGEIIDQETLDVRADIARDADDILSRRWLKFASPKKGGGDPIAKPRFGHGKVGRTAANITGIWRFNGTLDPVLIASNYAEHATGNLMTHFASFLLRNSTGRVSSRDFSQADRSRYARTEYLTQEFKSDEASEMNLMLNMLLDVGGMDAVRGFAAEMAPEAGTSGITEKITVAQAKAYLDQHVRGLEQQAEADEADAKKRFDLQNAMDKLRKWTDVLMTGGGITRSMDNLRFLEAFLVNEMNTEMEGERGFIDAGGLEESISEQGLQRTMLDMVAQHQGTDALLSMSNMNLGRRSPLTSVVDLFLKKHGVTEMALALAIDKYLTYGIRFAELYFPMSNTFSYLVTHNIISKAGGDYARVARDNQLGEGELHGLQKCIVYDLVKLGSTGLMAMFWYALHSLLGGDDDDEPDNAQANSWKEYAFGGTKVVPAWWMNDLVGWSLPAGTALYVHQKYGDPARTWSVFVNGCYDMYSGSSLLDTVKFIEDAFDNADVLNNMMTEEGYEPPEEWKERSMSSYMEELFADALQNSTPAVVRNYFPGNTRDTAIVGKDARDRSAYLLYTGEEGDRADNEVRQNADYDDVLRRTWARNNPFYGLVMDFANGINPFTDENGDKTGYLAYQMPIATKADQVSMQWYDKLELPEEWYNMDSDAKDKAAEDLIKVLNGFSSPEEALSRGFVLPWNARENLKQYCLAQKIKAESDYLEAEANGEYGYIDGRLANLDVKKYKAEMDRLLDSWVYNDKIPSSIGRYEKLISDNEVNFYWTATGEPANALDYMFNRDSVTKWYTPIGNHPTSFAPFTAVDEADRGYNAETKSFWYVPNVTDVQSVLDAVGSSKIKYGQDAGQLVEPTVMGSQDALNRDLDAAQRIPSDSSQSPTIGRRSYVHTGEKLPDSFKEEDLAKASERYGIDYARFEKLRDEIYNGNNNGSKNNRSGRTYGGVNYSRGGGGGSSYNPKIYSSKQRVYSTRAQGMNVSQPYKATSTYLRPGFATKGSREAYKRSDI